MERNLCTSLFNISTHGWGYTSFPFIREERDLRRIAYINTLKNQKAELVLHPTTLFWFTQKLVLILDHLFTNQNLTNDGSLLGDAWAYFGSLRSGELTWRKDNHFYMEAYNLHRFARLFSFF